MTYTATMQSAMAYCRGELSHAEFNLLCFIIQRTCRFDKLSETISLAEFQNGFTIGGPDTYVAPVTSNRTRVCIAINGLETKGYIEVRNTRGSNLYTLMVNNIVAIVCKIKEAMASKLKLGKTRKVLGSAESGTVVVPKVVLGSAETDTIEVTDSKVRDLKVIESAAGAAEQGFGKNKRARQKKASRLTKSRDSTRAAWSLAVAEHYDGRSPSTTISDRVWGKCKQASKQQTATDFRACMEWSVENWTSMKLYLDWVIQMTETPDIGLWCIHYKEFLKHWMNDTIHDEFTKIVREGSVDRDRLEHAEKDVTAARAQLNAEVQKREHLERRMHEKATQKRRQERRRRTNPDAPIPDALPEWENE